MVEHRPDQHRFVLVMPEGEARLAYRMNSPSVMNMVSTFVPPAARGQKIGAKITESALNYARDNGLQVIPSCWYVAEYIETHPEYQALLSPNREPNSGASCEIG